MSPAYKDRWTSYKYVENPDKKDYTAMMELMVYGEQPEVDIRGVKYDGAKVEPKFTTLNKVPNMRLFLTKMAQFETTLEDLSRRREIGRSKKEPYIFTRRGLIEFLEYLDEKSIIDRKTGKQISLEQDPKKIVLRAIQYYFLDKIANTEDLNKVKDCLSAVGIAEDNFTIDFSKEASKRALEKAKEESANPESLGAHEAADFLDKAFIWIGDNQSVDGNNWSYEIYEDNKIIDMHCDLDGMPFIDEKVSELDISGDAESSRGVKNLRKYLKNKKIKSLDYGGRWYLKIID